MRAKEFADNQFHASGDRLFCSTCNIAVDHTRKDSCGKHLETQGRKRRYKSLEESLSKKAKLQVSLSEALGQRSEAELEKESTLVSLVEAFAAANIPLHTLDNPKLRMFLQSNMKSCGVIPWASNLRRNYLPKAFNVHVRNLKELLGGSRSVAIVCDETTDREDRYILNVLAIPCCEEVEEPTLKAFLLECNVLESTNFKTVSDAVLKILQRYEISPLRVSAFVTDNATYMNKAWKDSLKYIFLNGTHVTCTAHLLNLVCEEWVSSFRTVNKLVCSIKRAFTACPARKARFKQFLRDNGKIEKLPPVPVLTRWNSWFRAALFHAEYLENYHEFFTKEMEGSSSSSLSETRDLCASPCVETQLAQLREYAPRIMEALTKYESNEVSAHLVSEDMALLIEWLEVFAAHEGNLEVTRIALQKSAERLRNYLSGEATAKFRQPAADFFRACRVFDPSNLSTTEIPAEFVIKNVRWFEDDNLAKAELQLYLSRPEELRASLHPVEFWVNAAPRFPNLAGIALSCLSVPVNSVAAERSFSQYSGVLRDDRRCIKSGNLSMYNMLYHNNEGI
ncbi:uncharacterized protein LOC100903363 [Galendromus occidentalis]|uniref:Uncharacterized protein LOC100903363 n=1 Tax=Galendromus occidentalis TaxID=34638 RepID=A0AAJ6VX94_9ACAR|nr:uncharacterized protein LOC100903363 [Galendromus occidentalis]